MTTQSKIFEVGIFGFLRILLRGTAQVMFQCNAWCGLLFLAGIFWGAYSSGMPEVAWGALLGVMVSTATGFILNLQPEEGQEGLWGFNGILVGCAFPTFLGDTIWMWIALALCAALTTWVRTGLNNLMRGWSINSFTFPFVLCTWFFLLGAHTMHSLPMLHSSSHVMESLHGLHHHMGLEGVWEAVQVWLRGISQVFLIDSWVTGLLFFLGLAISSRWAALWAVVGSALSMGMAVVMGMPVEHIDQGLYSFSAVLTAIALASVFYKPSWRSAMWATLGILVTVVVQAAMNVWVQPFGVATLTAPFCITTWLFLLPLLKFDEQHPDHSQWHHRS